MTKKILMISAALAALTFVGCASNPGYNGPVNQPDGGYQKEIISEMNTKTHFRAVGTAQSAIKDVAKQESLMAARRNLANKIRATMKVTEKEVAEQTRNIATTNGDSASVATVSNYYHQVTESVSNELVQNLNAYVDPVYKMVGAEYEYVSGVEMAFTDVSEQIVEKAKGGDPALVEIVKSMANKKLSDAAAK